MVGADDRLIVVLGWLSRPVLPLAKCSNEVQSLIFHHCQAKFPSLFCFLGHAADLWKLHALYFNDYGRPKNNLCSEWHFARPDDGS